MKRLQLLSQLGNAMEVPPLQAPEHNAEALADVIGAPSPSQQKASELSTPMTSWQRIKRMSRRGESTRVVPFNMPDQDDEKDDEALVVRIFHAPHASSPQVHVRLSQLPLVQFE